jgi:hypothetical protein
VKLGNYVAVVKHPSTTWINVEVKAAKRDGAPGSAIPAAAPISRDPIQPEGERRERKSEQMKESLLSFAFNDFS